MDIHKRGWSWKEILDSDIQEPPSIIPKMLYEMDNQIILGDAKTGKSLYTQQLAMSISKGDKFLDSMDITRPVRVLYTQCEGKMFETIPRAKKMSKEVTYDEKNLRWLILPSFPMNREDSAQKFCELVKTEFGNWRPEVVIFDPLYKLSGGKSLKDDDVATSICENLDKIKIYYGAAIILNHHQHRPQRDKKTGLVTNMVGDQSIFGSFVWRAWPDNIILFEPMPKQPFVRRITCDTQRSATIMKEMCVVLIQPDPLYWELLEDLTATDHMILQLLKKQKVMTITGLEDLTGLGNSTIHKSLRNLRKSGKVIALEEAGTFSVPLDKGETK